MNGVLVKSAYPSKQGDSTPKVFDSKKKTRGKNRMFDGSRMICLENSPLQMLDYQKVFCKCLVEIFSLRFSGWDFQVQISWNPVGPQEFGLKNAKRCCSFKIISFVFFQVVLSVLSGVVQAIAKPRPLMIKTVRTLSLDTCIYEKHTYIIVY